MSAATDRKQAQAVAAGAHVARGARRARSPAHARVDLHPNPPDTDDNDERLNQRPRTTSCHARRLASARRDRPLALEQERH